MKTSLDHLPEAKRRELARVVEILFAEFEDALVGKNAPHRKQGRILKVILFGSHARGDWVDDPVGGYTSDYDLLVVVNHEELTETLEYWAKAEDHLVRDYNITRQLTAPANFIVHSLCDVNKRLKKGRPFFVDIVRDGVALYEAPDQPFARSEPLSPAEALKEAEEHFAHWFVSAKSFGRNAGYAIRDQDLKLAAFLLHQSTERLYHCVLLVLTLYSPKSHKLNFLRSQAERLAPELIEAWPRETKVQQRCFELLRRAYVDARYSPHYKISGEELAWISKQIQVLEGLVEQVCAARLAALREAAAQSAQGARN